MNFFGWNSDYKRCNEINTIEHRCCHNANQSPSQISVREHFLNWNKYFDLASIQFSIKCVYYYTRNANNNDPIDWSFEFVRTFEIYIFCLFCRHIGHAMDIWIYGPIQIIGRNGSVIKVYRFTQRLWKWTSIIILDCYIHNLNRAHTHKFIIVTPIQRLHALRIVAVGAAGAVSVVVVVEGQPEKKSTSHSFARKRAPAHTLQQQSN